MRINAIILTLSKKVKRVRVDSELDFNYNGCLYELNPNNVCNKMTQSRKGNWILKDQVAVYFEGNPTPIGYADNSKALREKVIIVNALNQVAGAKNKTSRKKAAIILILVCLMVLGVAFWLTQMNGLNALKQVIRF